MTREDAKDRINHFLENLPKEPPTECDNVEEWLCEDDEIRKAFEMAIKALEPEPCDDAISRQAVLDVLMPYCADDDGSVENTDDLRNALDDIESLPSVNPTRPKGDFRKIWDRI